MAYAGPVLVVRLSRSCACLTCDGAELTCTGSRAAASRAARRACGAGRRSRRARLPGRAGPRKNRHEPGWAKQLSVSVVRPGDVPALTTIPLAHTSGPLLAAVIP